MLALGCILAQECHTGHCPTGIATQNRWLMRGLDPTSKAARLANYLVTLRKELLALAQACGQTHPALVASTGSTSWIQASRSVRRREVFGYGPRHGLPAAAEIEEIRALMKHAG